MINWVDSIYKRFGIADKVKEYGYDQHEGSFRMTKDVTLLSQVDMTAVPKPGLRKIASEEEVWDDLNIKKLDRYQFDSNIFIEYHGGENEDEIVILPINLQFKFFTALREGVGKSINGPSQEVAWKWDTPLEVNLLECQTINGVNT